MLFTYLTNIPLDRAKRDYIKFLKENGFASRTEIIPVQRSCGRFTAKAVYAGINAPHYAASAMDGAAVFAGDTFGATETTPVTLPEGSFTVVDTGDPVPDDKDAVIMVEDIVYNGDGSMTIHSPAAPWQHIRQIGEDICAGEMILPGYMEITPSAVGALIAGGVAELEVIAKPVVGIIPTGDEIVPPCSDPAPGDILEFNSSIFSSMVEKWGGSAKTYPIVPDVFDKIKAAVKTAAQECDIVLLNAGSSAGREDFSTSVIRELGEVLYHGIAIKPGKPAILGRTGNVPVLGVPGYPVSGIIVIEEFLKPLMEYWSGSRLSSEGNVKAVLSRPVVSGLKYEEFVRVRLGAVGDRLIASPLSRGSGVVSSFMKADGILRVPQDTEGYEAGTEVSINLLSSKTKLKNTLVVIGSHDPLIDELSDMIHTANRRMYVSSTHVGSMGGIMAIKRGEAHAAGIHLLDTESGGYNLSYLKKYFPDKDVMLLRCVGRNQGLMVRKGNPKGITGIKSLTKEGIRYVNRQKGSGTRILMDYLCEKENIAAEDIYGYEREEMTHNSVAVQIAGGSADAGMGIYSAAMLYDLDFIPICIEEYDLLIRSNDWNTPKIQQLVSVLKSDQFAKRIEAMGGYTLDRPGEVIPVFD